jgi:hypothetical protein
MWIFSSPKPWIASFIGVPRWRSDCRQSHPFPTPSSATMSKRQYDSVNDGTPGEDDARYGRASSSTATSYTFPVTDEIAEELYREVHGRVLNTLQPLYQLPCDDEEIKVRCRLQWREFVSENSCSRFLLPAARLLSQTYVYGLGRQKLRRART